MDGQTRICSFKKKKKEGKKVVLILYCFLLGYKKVGVTSKWYVSAGCMQILIWV